MPHRLALLLVAFAAASAPAQVTSDPIVSIDRRPDGGGTLILDEPSGNAELTAKLVELFGESAMAGVYEAIGPDARAFAQHNMTLSNRFFEGRVPGSNGNRLAAEYIEHWFVKSGLEPAFPGSEPAADGTEVITPSSSYRQTFNYGTELNVHDSAAAFNLGAAGVRSLRLNSEYTILGMSGSGTVTAPIVFVGYSVEGGRDGYKSYPDGTDLTGKIAVLLRFEPMDAEGRSKWARRGWSPASSLDAKVHRAAARGAAGIIVVNPPGAADHRATQLSTSRDTMSEGGAQTIPVIMADADAVEQLMQAADPTDGPARSLMEFRKLADAEGGVIDLPNATATITTRLSVEPVKTDNVGGVLRGRGSLADQYLVIGAHYDHVGTGPVGVRDTNFGKLHPGADDNASGTSGMLVLADKLSRAYAELPAGAAARSIVFLAFSAEEGGLHGSEHYVNHPSVPLDRVKLMINLDMIGRLRADPGLEIGGTQSGDGLYDWLKPFFDGFSGVPIKHGPEIASNSDHANFYNKKIPILFFFTGLHPDYHTPTDTAFGIDPIGAARVIDLAYRVTAGAAQRDELFPFAPRRRPEATRAAEDRPDAARPRVVRFGIVPERAAEGVAGVLVGSVYERTTASEAGFKPGDRITAWNGKPIADIQAWTALLRSHKPGDEVEIAYERSGESLTAKVTLRARDDDGR